MFLAPATGPSARCLMYGDTGKQPRHLRAFLSPLHCFPRICVTFSTFARIQFFLRQPHLGRQLHSLQLQIASRGASLLAVGGMMAYSTCSLNPIENEAVIAALLQRHPDLELVDASPLLPGLRRRPGLTSWKVFDDRMRHLRSFEVSQRRRVPKCERRCWRRTMWPPPADSTPAAYLPRCLRLLPHLQDTGGFFVALLRRTASLPRQPRAFSLQPASKDKGWACEEASDFVQADRRRVVRPSHQYKRAPASLLLSVVKSVFGLDGDAAAAACRRLEPRIHCKVGAGGKKGCSRARSLVIFSPALSALLHTKRRDQSKIADVERQGLRAPGLQNCEADSVGKPDGRFHPVRAGLKAFRRIPRSGGCYIMCPIAKPLLEEILSPAAGE